MEKLTINPCIGKQIYRGLVFCAYPAPENSNWDLVSLREEDPGLVFLMFNGFVKNRSLPCSNQFPDRYLEDIKRDLTMLTMQNVDKVTKHAQKLTTAKADYILPARMEYLRRSGLAGSLSPEEFLPHYLAAAPGMALDRHDELEDFLKYFHIPHVTGNFTREYDMTCDQYKCYYFYRDGREFTAAAEKRYQKHSAQLAEMSPPTNFIVETLVSSHDGLTAEALQNNHGELEFVRKDLDALLAREDGKYAVYLPRAEPIPPALYQPAGEDDFTFTDQKVRIFVDSLKEAQNLTYFYREWLDWEADLEINKNKTTRLPEAGR